jgi:predicted nuclease of predicted toxin-antitoxin system
MLKFLSDENFNGDVLRGLRLRIDALDILRVQDVGLAGRDDAAVLDWASANGRLVLTHDRATMPDHAFRRILRGDVMPGVIVIGDRLPTSLVISELLVIAECGESADFANRV